MFLAIRPKRLATDAVLPNHRRMTNTECGLHLQWTSGENAGEKAARKAAGKHILEAMAATKRSMDSGS